MPYQVLARLLVSVGVSMQGFVVVTTSEARGQAGPGELLN